MRMKLLLISFHLFTFCSVLNGQNCGQPLVHKNKKVDGSPAIQPTPIGDISSGDCLRLCCETSDCTTLTFTGFLTSSTGACLLYACGESCVLMDEDSADGYLTITLNRNTNAAGTELPATTNNSAAAGNASSSGAGVESVTPVATAGTFNTLVRSCSTPIGIAIFVTVFCFAINLGLLVSLMWRHRQNTGHWHTAHNSAGTSSTAGTSGLNHTNNGKAHHGGNAAQTRSKQALQAYNNVALEA